VCRAIVLAAAIVAAGANGSGAEVPLPDFLCHAVRGGMPLDDATANVADRFGARQARVNDLVGFCRPARAAFGATPAPALPLATFTARVPRSARRVGEAVDVVTRLGTERLHVKSFSHVRTEASIDDDSAPSGAVTACYQVKARGKRERGIVVVADERGEHALRVGAPEVLCVGPADDGYLCHRGHEVRIRGGGRGGGRERVGVTTPYGVADLAVRRAVALCVPTGYVDPPPPPGDFFLRISPSSRTVTAGSRPTFEARAYFAVGGSENWSDRVLWRSSDERVAIARSSAGGAIIDAVGEGTATISVLHVPTDVTSTTSDGDAELTVVWPLEKLVISPPAVRKKVGDTEEYTVLGHFAGGTTLNLTQRVTFSARPEGVASVHVDSARRSLVRANAPGNVTITATDPDSGISTADAGNDALLRIGGGQPWVMIDPNRESELTLRVGALDHLTAIAHYPDLSTRNLTQECRWESSDPAVVRTPNDPGDRSRIEGVGGGNAIVNCWYPEGTIVAATSVDVVTDELVALELRNGQRPPIRDGHPRSVTALGVFAPFSVDTFRGRLNLTQQVVYVSRDPDVAIATNEDGNRSRIVGVSPGSARIYAYDPTTGIESPDHVLYNLGRLTGIALGRSPFQNRLPLGGRWTFAVSGQYEGGGLRLPPGEASYVLETSDPGVVGVDETGQTILAVGAGYAMVHARHLATGFESEPQPLVVQGEIDRLEMTPAAITRAIGEGEEYTVVGLSPPAFDTRLTQDVEYRSSDHSVAVVSNEPPRRSVVRAVGAGRATITASYPPAGVTPPSGNRVTTSAVLDVLPGAIERITIQPAEALASDESWIDFTAIGHYADGATINVTSQVTWVAVDATVAAPLGSPRSRFGGIAPGTTRIVATHPTGVSSADSDDDALLRVERMIGIALSPSTRTTRVGETVRFTVTGRLGNGSQINLTQRALYYAQSESWEHPVARADNEDGDRSAIVALAPGVATIHAQVASRSVMATLTVEP